MQLKEYIKNEIFLPRLKKNGILVIYDRHGICRNACLELETPKIKVIDAGESSILSREAALKTLYDFGKYNSKLEGMAVYVPAKPPVTEEDKQRDPFSVYGACGNIFPDGDGDDYINICLKFKPDHSTEVRKVFSENKLPSFETIDAIGSGGTGWPTLHAALKVDSAAEILTSILAPSDEQARELQKHDGWVSELKELLAACLGMKLITKSKALSTISEEIWRFVLYSEFVFDLPEPLPGPLSKVPKAPENARFFVESLCDTLRDNIRYKPVYIEKAELVETEIGLAGHCGAIKNFGVRDTFAFEERKFIEIAIDEYLKDNIDTVKSVLERHSRSVWTADGEISLQWSLIGSAVKLFTACEDSERQLAENSRTLEALVEYYTCSLRETDLLQREFEQFAGDFAGSETLEPIIDKTRKKYSALAGKVQCCFIRHVEKSGWPLNSKLSNAGVFDAHITPKLQENGNRTALILVDSLRYELGVELEKQIAGQGQAEIHCAMAQLPSITLAGMAALLPDACGPLSFELNDEGLTPLIGGEVVNTAAKRMELLKKNYGQRFAEMPLIDFINSKKKVPASIELLVLRSVEIDSSLESDPQFKLKMIHEALRRIKTSVDKLKKAGFKYAVIATDHGFMLNYDTDPGGVCSKPPGVWANIHDRLLLGDGNEDAYNFAFSAAHLGITGNFSKAAGPRAAAPYRAGMMYFHGGLSLQECVLPVITLKMKDEKADENKLEINLSYKNGASKITTRRPVIELTARLWVSDMHSAANFDVSIEAHDKKGKVVGEAKTCEGFNPSTGTVNVLPDKTIQVTMKMEDDFEGEFVVKVLNPSTMTEYCKLELETNYMG
jgi:hypothetical protein